MDAASYRTRLAYGAAFAVAMAFVEAAVVVYLRQIFYPDGFYFPLKTMTDGLIGVEFGRELATVVMLWTAAWLSGKIIWERFGYFLFLFGVWDIFYYVWLKMAIDWPASLFDWDILFLIPLPWIGPVIAPIVISLLMIIFGYLIIRLYARGQTIRPNLFSWIVSVIGTAAILFSFIRDTDATLDQEIPQPYLYSFLLLGLICYLIAFVPLYRRRRIAG